MIKSINIALRFLLEIFVLMAVGYWGFTMTSNWVLKIVFGLFFPVLIAVVWGRYGAPKSPNQLHGLMLLILEVLVFGSGVAALFFAGRDNLALTFAVILVVNRFLMFVWRQ